MTSRRPPFPIKLVLLVASLLTLSAAAGDAKAATLEEVNALRAAHGLTALSAAADGSPLTQVAQAIAASASASGLTADKPLSLTSCMCSDYEEATSTDLTPTVRLRRAGASGVADGWVLGPGALREQLAARPFAHAILLDPRARELAIAPLPAGAGQALIVSIDPAAAWSGLTVIPGTPALVLLPPGAKGAVRVEVRGNGRWQPRGTLHLDDIRASDPDSADTPWAPTTTGATLILLADQWGTSLTRAWGSTYRVRAAGRSGRIASAPLPASFLRRRFTYAPSMKLRERRLVRQAVAHASAAARRILRVIDGMTYIAAVNNGPASHAGGDPVKVRGHWLLPVTLQRSHFHLPRAQREDIILHELGHIVSFSGAVSDSGFSAFVRQWKRSPRWRSCFRRTGPFCTATMTEVFADQFAFFARGGRTAGNVGYGDPVLASPNTMRRLFAAHFHPELPNPPCQGCTGIENLRDIAQPPLRPLP